MARLAKIAGIVAATGVGTAAANEGAVVAVAPAASAGIRMETTRRA